MDEELETTSTPTTSHSQRKERRSKGSQTTAPREASRKYRAFQCSHGTSSAPAATTAVAWVASAHLLPHEFPGISTGSHMGVSAASPRWPHLTHTDPTPAPALWDLSQVFWRKLKLSDTMNCLPLALPSCKSCCFAGVFSGLLCLHPFLRPPFCVMYPEQKPTQIHQEQSSTSITPPAPEGSRQQNKPSLRDTSASQGHLEKGG